MKGRRAIRLRQWMAITISTPLVALLSILYDISMRHLAIAEKISPSVSLVHYVVLNLTGAFIAGALIGAFMVYYLQDRLSDKPYGYSVIILLIIVITVITITRVPYYLIYAAQQTGMPVASTETMKEFRKIFHIADPVYFILMPLVAMQQLMLQVSNKFGPGVLWKIIRGTYNSPKIENRIFMFADLNDSTTIAETLSDERYHQFLRNYFGNITNSILEYGGEIYQYLGDGIIIVWKYYGDERDLQCIDCFFDMKKEIEKKREKYQKKYGVVPGFKAGIHCGKVVVGEIGIIKRDISYSGDVVNTASRIQSMCKELKSELLISNELLRSFPPVSGYETKSVGSIHLKGKVKDVELSSVGLK
jgi:adenylate cyclase